MPNALWTGKVIDKAHSERVATTSIYISGALLMGADSEANFPISQPNRQAAKEYIITLRIPNCL